MRMGLPEWVTGGLFDPGEDVACCWPEGWPYIPMNLELDLEPLSSVRMRGYSVEEQAPSPGCLVIAFKVVTRALTRSGIIHEIKPWSNKPPTAGLSTLLIGEKSSPLKAHFLKGHSLIVVRALI